MSKQPLPCRGSRRAERFKRRVTNLQFRSARMNERIVEFSLRRRRPNKAARLAKELIGLISATATADSAKIAALERRLARMRS